jgi:hypothetical protein
LCQQSNIVPIYQLAVKYAEACTLEQLRLNTVARQDPAPVSAAVVRPAPRLRRMPVLRGLDPRQYLVPSDRTIVHEWRELDGCTGQTE